MNRLVHTIVRVVGECAVAKEYGTTKESEASLDITGSIPVGSGRSGGSDCFRFESIEDLLDLDFCLLLMPMSMSSGMLVSSVVGRRSVLSIPDTVAQTARRIVSTRVRSPFAQETAFSVYRVECYSLSDQVRKQRNEALMQASRDNNDASRTFDLLSQPQVNCGLCCSFPPCPLHHEIPFGSCRMAVGYVPYGSRVDRN